MAIRCNFRELLDDGDTSVAWANMPQAPAVGDEVLLRTSDSATATWVVTKRLWLPMETSPYCSLTVKRRRRRGFLS